MSTVCCRKCGRVPSLLLRTLGSWEIRCGCHPRRWLNGFVCCVSSCWLAGWLAVCVFHSSCLPVSHLHCFCVFLFFFCFWSLFVLNCKLLILDAFELIITVISRSCCTFSGVYAGLYPFFAARLFIAVYYVAKSPCCTCNVYTYTRNLTRSL